MIILGFIDDRGSYITKSSPPNSLLIFMIVRARGGGDGEIV